jgi:hypothetical protein
MNQTEPSARLTNTAAELMLYGIILFLASRQLQDLIISERSYGYGRVIYPFVFALVSVPLHLKIRNSNYSRMNLLLIVLVVFWASSSLAMLIDAIINLDFWFQMTSSWRNRFGIFMSVIVGPWIILTPAVGALATLLFSVMLRRSSGTRGFGPA